MLRVRNLTTNLLHVPMLDVAEGECVAVMGPSGAGKSLLLRAIADLDPNEGEVSINGITRGDVPAYEWRRQVVLIPAESGWWADIVGAHFPERRPNSDQAAADRPSPDQIDADHLAIERLTADLLSSVGLTQETLRWNVSRLSSGERQRLAIVRALVLQPKALLLDEPTASLDAASIERVEALLKQQRQAGVAVLLITHDAQQAKRLAGRTLRISGGRLTSDPESDPESDGGETAA